MELKTDPHDTTTSQKSDEIPSTDTISQPNGKSGGDPKSKEKKDPNAAPKGNPKDDLKTIPMPDLMSKLDSSKDGLTEDEAKKRLTKYGANQLVEKKDNAFLKFLSYFWGPIPWMIEAAVILSGVVRHWLDFFHYSASIML